jgi:hypothetical protein
MKLKSYKFDAWIHPKYGGDDYPVSGVIKAYYLEVAKKALEKELSKKSAIANDYVIKEDLK